MYSYIFALLRKYALSLYFILCFNCYHGDIKLYLHVVIDSRIFLCDFHREPAWLWWLSSSNNNMRENIILYCMRKIAFSETFEEYCANMSSLKDSDIWNDAKSKEFRNWIEIRGYQNMRCFEYFQRIVSWCITVFYLTLT